MGSGSSALQDALKQRILVLDGAMGTAIQEKNLTEKDFGGPQTEGCNEYLCVIQPDVIRSIHDAHLKAGADIIETDSFGGVPFVLGEFGLEDRAHEINLASARLAREMADKHSTPDRPRFVAGSLGPTTKAISVTGGIDFASLSDHYYQQTAALYEGGVDYFLLETCQDTRNIKAALVGLDRLFKEMPRIPVAVSVTIEPMGTMLAGQTAEAVYTSLAHHDLLYIGLNCATGPEFMTDHLRSLAELASCPVACVPNAGLPDEDGQYLETPEMMVSILQRFLDSGWVNLLGGCCGTTVKHTAAFSKLANGAKPRDWSGKKGRSTVSGVDFLEITDEMRPVIVGERTNVIGSRKFKRLITSEAFDEASEIARAQVKNGAHIIDVCLANPDRDEFQDMQNFLETAVKKIRVPLMIDSTDAKVIEMALTYSQGKALINSINLEDGEERFEQVVPLGKKYGAAFVVGTIDDDPDQGMGVTRARKLEIAERSYKLLTEKYGVAPEDIYWDPLVFPCGTGDQQYVGSAVETVEGVRLIKEKYPQTKTILGISNVSFGLPPAGREVLNSVFLYHCTKAGLDLAIVNSEKLERYASIPENEKKVAEDLLYNRGEDPLTRFTETFREKKPSIKEKSSNLSLDERLANYIIEGTKDGLVEDLEKKRKDTAPLAIINGPLMAGMDEVGRLFNENKLIVAEVLQSAEAMKAAVAHLEPYMEKDASASRGKVVLATVKGDVHDIGKNLVEIILSNNGFEVINLGIKIPPEQLIAAIRKHSPDIIGLSGLLVKSAQQMVTTAEDLTKAGTTPPMLVGGAALSEKFVNRRISKAYEGTTIYASDAMNGLELSKRIVDKQDFEKLQAELTEKRAREELSSAQKPAAAPVAAPARRSKHVPIQDTPPQPPDFRRHIVRSTPIDLIWSYINPLMLYTRHLGMKGAVTKQLMRAARTPDTLREFEKENPKAVEIYRTIQEIKTDFRGTDLMKPTAVYQFLKASSEGNSLILNRDNGKKRKPLEIEFPRQAREDGLCLADYVNPAGKPTDNVALFAVTVGQGMREYVEELKARGEYLKTHILQVLAFESAEAYAELLHSELRMMWGFPDAPETSMMDRFQAKYRGKRYSFGYPACPRLDDQKVLFEILKPEEVGIELTDGFMMDPEASVTAIAFHHPDAVYYSVGQASEALENRV